MTGTRFGLRITTIEAIKSIFSKRPEIERVMVYGSRAMGNHKAGSDIDIVLMAPNLKTTDLLRIESELDDLMLPYKVDLSLYHQIENQDLLEHIRRVSQEFSGN